LIACACVYVRALSLSFKGKFKKFETITSSRNIRTVYAITRIRDTRAIFPNENLLTLYLGKQLRTKEKCVACTKKKSREEEEITTSLPSKCVFLDQMERLYRDFSFDAVVQAVFRCRGTF
jgi:hypothetical protein